MTTASYAYEPAELIPPGRTLDEWLERADMTKADFAKRTSLTPKHIHQVLRGAVGISPEVAIAFERVTRVPARYWLQLDANYQAAHQRASEAADLATHTDLVDLFPVKELERLGVIDTATSKVGKLAELLRFFAVADTRALLSVSVAPAMFRLSTAYEASDAALATWLRLAELEAGQIDAAPFDAAACREAIDEMRSLSRLPGIEWLTPLRELAASVGIAIVIIKELPKCRVNGATRWLSPDKAMVALSLRHRRNDIFWFTLFHELCHILRHSKKHTFVDAVDSRMAADLEDEANAFAARTLIPPQFASRLPHLRTAAEVAAFAKEIGIAPGIVVGRLQREKYLQPNQLTALFDRYRFADD